MATFPIDWFWIVGGDASRAWSSLAGAYVSQYPDGASRIASEAELADVLQGYGLAGPVVTDAAVKREYMARLVAILGADDIGHAGFIRADNDCEMRALLALPAGSAQDAARIAELAAVDAAVNALIEKYNALVAPYPADYRDGKWWR
jgi:hypothetical protein